LIPQKVERTDWDSKESSQKLILPSFGCSAYSEGRIAFWWVPRIKLIIPKLERKPGEARISTKKDQKKPALE